MQTAPPMLLQMFSLVFNVINQFNCKLNQQNQQPKNSLKTGVLVIFISLNILFFSHSVNAVQPIVIKKVVDFQEDKNLVINSESVFNLPPNVIKAIHHEIPLSFKIQIQLLEDTSLFGFSYQRARNTIEFHTQLQASGVNRIYTLFNSRNKKIQSFQTLDSALQALATLESFPIASLSELHPKQRYTLRMRIHLDFWKLKAPLQLEALLSDDWDIDSDWFETTLQTPMSWQ